jgi:hypothetical protein
MRLREFWGIPIDGTEKAVGLKKVKRNGKTFYAPAHNNPRKYNDKNSKVKK